jgi:hypothetical protein
MSTIQKRRCTEALSFALTMVATFLFLGCGGSSTPSPAPTATPGPGTPTPTPTPTPTASVSAAMTLQGEDFTHSSSAGDNAVLFYPAAVGDDFIVDIKMRTQAGTNPTTIIINIPATGPGTYSFNHGWQIDGSIWADIRISAQNGTYANDGETSTGNITITSVTDTHVSGTFSGTVKQFSNGALVNVTGSFKARRVPTP